MLPTVVASCSPYLMLQCELINMVTRFEGTAGAVALVIRKHVRLLSAWEDRREASDLESESSLDPEFVLSFMLARRSLAQAAAERPLDAPEMHLEDVEWIHSLGWTPELIAWIEVPLNWGAGTDAKLVYLVMNPKKLSGLRFQGVFDRWPSDPAPENALLRLALAFITSQLALCCSLNSKDPYTLRHSVHVAEYVTHLLATLAREDMCCVGEDALLDADAAIAHNAGLVHDLGKIRTPRELLWKPTTVTKDEATILGHHSLEGYAIMCALDVPEAEHTKLSSIVLNHHNQAAGEVLVRLTRFADCYDAMRTDRPYRKALDEDSVRADMVFPRDMQGLPKEAIEKKEDEVRRRYGFCKECRSKLFDTLNEVYSSRHCPQQDVWASDALDLPADVDENKLLKVLVELFDLVITKGANDRYLLSKEDEEELKLVRQIVETTPYSIPASGRSPAAGRSPGSVPGALWSELGDVLKEAPTGSPARPQQKPTDMRPKQLSPEWVGRMKGEFHRRRIQPL
jgi:HD-GYP domain-containing protein (c-di-GMP phosphodiesterase class II)